MTKNEAPEKRRELRQRPGIEILFDRLESRLAPLIDRPRSPAAEIQIKLIVWQELDHLYADGYAIEDDKGAISRGDVEVSISFGNPCCPEISFGRIAVPEHPQNRNAK